jgi:DNA-binding beta-propeller fold protein YncE
MTVGSKGVVAVIAAVALTLLASVPSVLGSATFCGSGSGAGQCASPRNIAVDVSAHRLYVADSANNRVNVFNADNNAFVEAFGWGVKNGNAEFQTCTTATTCRAGIAGAGKGQFNRPTGIAIDPSNGNLYVTEPENLRVQKFDPAAVPSEKFLLMFGGGVDKTVPGNVCTAASGHTCGAGSNGAGEGEFSSTNGSGIYVSVAPGGIVYALDSRKPGGPNGPESEFKARLQKFEPSGTAIVPQHFLFEGGAGKGLAVDSTGFFWTIGGGAIRKYDASGTLPALKTIPAFNPRAISVNVADSVFVAGNEFGSETSIGEYDSGGTQLLRFGYRSFGKSPFDSSPQGLALYESVGGDIYASAGGDVFTTKMLAIDFPPPGPLVFPEPCNANPRGNTKATLNAEVNPEGKATTYHFQMVTEASFQQEGFAGATRVPAQASEDAVLAADFDLHKATAEASLVPETKYRCRVVAKNLDGEATGEEGLFESKQPIEFVPPVWATEVETESAIVNAIINPLGIPATGYFEYVTDAAFQVDGFAQASKAPDVAESETPLDFGAGESPKAGSTQLSELQPGTLYHYRIVGANAFVPAGRPGPEGTFRTPRSGGGGLPDGRAWELVSPAQKGSAEVAIPGSAGGLFAKERLFRIQAAASSGEAIAYTSWTSFEQAEGAPPASQYLSKRSAGGWGTENVSPAGFMANPLEPPYRGFASDLAFGGFVVSEPPLTEEAQKGVANLYLRDNQTGALQALTTEAPQFIPASEQGLQEFCTAYAGASADGSRAFFAANGAMAGAPAGVGFSLYEWSAGEGLRLISVLPDSTPSLPAVSSGFGAGGGRCSMDQSVVAHAISADGSVAFWTYGGKFKGSEEPLMARIDGTETVQLDAKDLVSPGPGPTGHGRFWAATPDGSKAFFTAPGQLTASAGAPEGQLYRYDTAARSLIDLTPGSIAPLVQGVLGVSDDGAYAYFVAKGTLTGAEENAAGQKAKAGSYNLYLYHEGEGVRFIAQLSGLDDSDWSSAPSALTSRVTPDGRHLAFLSVETEALTGYNNIISPSGGCHPEIENKLEGDPHCAEAYIYNAGDDELTCASCNPSEARPLGPTELPFWSNPLEGPRYLSDDGARLFFESRDVLSPADENKRRDVYEFEQAGAGTCSADNPGFDPISGGCIFLISSGGSGDQNDESYFLDASSSARDVFFATRSALVGWDTNDNYDVYDAREGGGFAEPPEEPSPCAAEACKPPATQPPPGSSPATPNFQGPGNPVEKPKKKHHKHKGKKHKGKHKGTKHKRTNHERRPGG